MITPGGSLMLAWQVKQKNSLVVGAGDVAFGRIEHLLSADSIVTVIAPRVTNADVQSLIESGSVSYIEACFTPEHLDLKEWAIALTAIDSRSESRRVYDECKKRKIPINCADIPDVCDFYFGSMIRQGPVQIMVSTNGNAPRLARRIRQNLEQSIIEDKVALSVENIGKLRQMLRQRTTAVGANGEEVGYEKETIKKRMKWLSDLCDGMTFKEMGNLTESDMEKIIDKYPAD